MNPLITLLFLMNLVRTTSIVTTTPLIENAELNTRAEIRAERLCKDNQWSHKGIDDNFVGVKGYEYGGENLAKDFPTDLDAFIALMNSPSHKANIINPVYTQIGIGRSEKCNLTVQLFTN